MEETRATNGSSLALAGTLASGCDGVRCFRLSAGSVAYR